MKTVFAKHEPYTNGHLGQVIEDMRLAGSPTIRVVQRGDKYYALEGSHRLYAAFTLSLEPKLIIMQEDAGEGLDSFWNRVAPELPRYDFDHIHVLELASFTFKD